MNCNNTVHSKTEERANMKKLKLLFIMSILLSSTLNANAALKVTPTVIELQANKVKGNYITTSFNVQGAPDETIRFKVYPSYFEITEEGKMGEIQNATQSNSLVNNARFIPNEFTLVNGNPQKVRLTIANLDKLPDGESRMVLFLEDVQAKEVILPYANKNVTTKLIVKTRVGIPVYVDKGRFVKCGQFDDLTIKKDKNDLYYKLKLSSSGNSKVRYMGKAQIIKNKQLVSEFPVNSNTIKSMGNLYSTEKIPLENIKECGEYTLRIVLNYQDEKGKTKNMIKETVFTVENIQHNTI